MTITELLSRLVAFPTVSHRSNLELIAFTQKYLEDYGIQTYLVRDKKEDKASLHCRIGPAVDGGIILSGHTDVVPVEGQPWDTDPFQLTERNGKLYGRGSADMKGFLACCLSCLPEMTTAELKRPIYFAFSYDEEVGCQAAPALVDQIRKTYEESPKFAIIGEPSEMQPILGQKGISTFRTTVTGSQGHSSRIREEVSAIHVAARLIRWIEDRMDVLIRTGRLDRRFDPPHSTLHVGIIQGGIAANVIAGSCNFDWDLRVIPRDKAEDILADFQSFCRHQEGTLRKRFPGTAIRTEAVYPGVPALDTPEESPAADLIRRLTGVENYLTVAYASEAGQFAEGGFETVICGPGSIAQAHRANEFISVEQLEKGAEFIRKVVRCCEA
jgi:acetylornithine deacetylase